MGLFLGQAGTWPQCRGTGSIRVQQAFLGAAGIRPLLGETLPQREQVKAVSFRSKGPGKTAAYETKLGIEVLPGTWSWTVKKQGVEKAEDRRQVHDC